MFFKKAVLIIHGFGGSANETKILRKYLEDNSNFDVYNFTLPGHEAKILRSVKYGDWINASIEEIEKLIKKYNTVYLIGHSMGGVIASHLASKYQKVKKLVLLSPAFMYVNFNQLKKDIKNKFINKQEDETETYKSIISKAFCISPLCYLEFMKLVKKYHNSPENITCSTLIMHGTEDSIVPIESSKYVYDTIKSRNKYMIFIKNVKHRVLNSRKKEIINKYVNEFLKGGLKWIIKRKSEI